MTWQNLRSSYRHLTRRKIWIPFDPCIQLCDVSLWQRWHQTTAVFMYPNWGLICPWISKPPCYETSMSCWMIVLGLEVWSPGIGMRLQTLHSGPCADHNLALITMCGMSHDSYRAVWHISPSFTALHPVKVRWLHTHTHTPHNSPP